MRVYPAVMGERWNGLPDAIRRAHLADRTLQGTFEVGHGDHWFARTLSRLLRVPAEASGVPVTLRIEPAAMAERWQRSFAGRPLITTQRCRSAGILDEQVGVLELRFRLEAAANALRYDQIDARLRVGRFSMPWPRWCRPRVDAVELAEPGALLVIVDVTLPGVGLLFNYRGRLVVPASGSS
jgi:hypothetical protein